MLENTEWATKNGQSRETGNIGHTGRSKKKKNSKKTNTKGVGHNNTHINTNNIRKTWALLQTTETVIMPRNSERKETW